MESTTLDELDRGLIHALQIRGRAPFSQIAAVLDVSDQTVARRYRRLRSSGLVRVVGSVDGRRAGYDSWSVRLRCVPDASVGVANALARRSDTFWVQLLSGGTEITCGILARTPEERDALLLRQLPRTSKVISVSAHWALRMFVGGRVGWAGLAALPEERASLLRADRPEPGPDEPVVLDDRDHALLAALSVDGRTGHAELSAVTGWSESTVRRRMEFLERTGALYYDLDVPPDVLGFRATALLWMSVRPASVTAVGEALAAHSEVAMASATTGPTNMMASVVCRDTADLHRYLTERIGSLAGIHDVETSPIIRTVKRAGAVLPA